MQKQNNVTALPVALPGAAPTLATTVAKWLLCLLGFTLLFWVSQSLWAPVVLLATTALSFVIGLAVHAMARSALHTLVARAAVPLALVGLVLLNVTGLIGTLTGAQAAQELGASSALIAMPFYLLSAAAFMADMAGQRTRPPGFLDFLVYMALPFKLLAGPLESPRLLEQIQRFSYSLRRSRLLVAWPWLAMGAFMKYVVANRLDPARHLVDTDPITSFLTAAVFELKFYFDFAGYSFMAYGAAIAVGLRISQNFDSPFLAPNVVLFWRRWHMSLGRFLSRYVLEPNLSLWNGRTQKLLFASAIFLVSAMWHGGTLNYLFWGLFHGSCYFAYGQWMKRRTVLRWAGILAMLLFFVVGRMFAIDANSARLLTRLAGFFDPAAYAGHLGLQFLTSPESGALVLAALFLAAEVWSSKRYPHRQGYHLLRRPVCALIFSILFVLFGDNTGTLLYARI